VHKQPIFCIRCFKSFKDETELEAHARHDNPSTCKLEPLSQTPEGLTKAQEKDLRARRVDPKTDIEKWNNIWEIVFPGIPVVDLRESEGSSFRINNNMILEQFNSKRYDDRLRSVLEQLKTMTLQDPDSTTVQAMQVELINIIQEDEPVTSPASTDDPEQAPQSISSGVVLASNNPYLHRIGRTASQLSQTPSITSRQFQTTVENPSFLPSFSVYDSDPIMGNQNWSQQRPSKVKPGGVHGDQNSTGTLTSTPFHPQRSSQHYQASQLTLGDESSEGIPMFSRQMDQNWSSSPPFQTGTQAFGGLGSIPDSTSAGRYHAAQSQNQQVSSDHERLQLYQRTERRPGWFQPPNSNTSGLWNN
jgi:hypothetical protein